MSSLVQIQIRRDVAANWTAANPVLKSGEPGLETDTGRLKFGDGATAWNSLPYFQTDANFVHTQAVASTSWTVTHNLGKKPAVMVVDSAGTVFQAEINYINDNQIIINLNAPTTGKAYIN